MKATSITTATRIILSPHPGGTFVFGDGGVRFVPYTIGSSLFKALTTRSGGEVVDLTKIQ